MTTSEPHGRRFITVLLVLCLIPLGLLVAASVLSIAEHQVSGWAVAGVLGVLAMMASLWSSLRRTTRR